MFPIVQTKCRTMPLSFPPPSLTLSDWDFGLRSPWTFKGEDVQFLDPKTFIYPSFLCILNHDRKAYIVLNLFPLNTWTDFIIKVSSVEHGTDQRKKHPPTYKLNFTSHGAMGEGSLLQEPRCEVPAWTLVAFIFSFDVPADSSSQWFLVTLALPTHPLGSEFISLL